jgi:hypothetical protein
MIWKQWKHGKQRYAQLRHLGTSRELAAQTAGSPHGPWHLANSPALSSALPIAYFDSREKQAQLALRVDRDGAVSIEFDFVDPLPAFGQLRYRQTFDRLS